MTSVDHVSISQLERRTRRAFFVFISGFIVFAMVFIGIKSAEKEDDLMWPLRRALDFNAAIGEALVSPDRADLASFAPVRGKKARVNGDIGLRSDFDPAKWALSVVVPMGPSEKEVTTTYTMNDIRALPKVEVTNEFKCIEGWSEVMSFAGIRFVDFLKRYNLGTKSRQTPDPETRPQDLYRYVGFETPDGEYFVSIDMRSMLGPQVLLAYEQNGEPLSVEHGAPLRLYIPNKYGVKSLKRIGKIVFSDEPLPDFWGARGYDWFIGL